jgi:hypothetical protein
MKTKAILIRRNAAVGFAALGTTLTLVAAGLLANVGEPVETVLAPVIVFGWPVALALSVGWLGYWRPRRDEVLVEAASGGLSVDGRTRRHAGALARGEATVLDDSGVRLVLRGWPRPSVRLIVPNIALAREVLASLGLDRRAGTSQFRIRRLRPYENLLLLTLFFLSFPAVIALCIVSGTLGLVGLVAAVLSALAIRALARVELTVGSDGLHLRSPLRRAFIPHGRIRTLQRIWPTGSENGSTHDGEVVSWGFELVLVDGTKHRLDTRPERFPAGVWKTDHVFASAFAAWSTSQTEDAPAVPHASALLARGSRPTREWIASLRELATDGASGYRVAALDARALFAILADAGAARELRAGAAIALGGRKEHAPRLRIAADDVADPVVRRVAVASASGDPAGAALLEDEVDEVIGGSRASVEPTATSRR